MEDLSWWTITSTILSIIFFVVNIAQIVAYKKEQKLIYKEKEIHKSQVKIWQHCAKGIQMGLHMISVGNFSSVNDTKEGVKSIQQSAQSLLDSLIEERLFTDAEVKEKQIQRENEIKDLMAKANQKNA